MAGIDPAIESYGGWSTPTTAKLNTPVLARYFFFCVKAEAAADLACLDALGSFSTMAADDATFLLVVS